MMVAAGTEVCSLHFRLQDLRKSFYVVSEGVATKLVLWQVPSPR